MISTHAPLAGHDRRGRKQRPTHQRFQPTRPLRGTTFPVWLVSKVLANFNPRAPCGARQRAGRGIRPLRGISTHAPLAGHDVKLTEDAAAEVKISTHAPLAGHDFHLEVVEGLCRISTHAPLAGHDSATVPVPETIAISTHAPLAGHDRKGSSGLMSFITFQPTRPLRGTTCSFGPRMV